MKNNNKSKTKDKLAWLYLCNLVFYFIPMFVDARELSDDLISLAIIPVYVLVYFQAYRCPTKQVHYPILGLLTLAIIATPFNSGSMALFSFVGFFCGFHYSLKRLAIIIPIIVLLLFGLNIWLFPNYYFFGYASAIYLALSLIGYASSQKGLANRQKQQSAEEIKTLATIVERERIARDLHDLIGHSLSSISLKAELAETLIQQNRLEEAQQHLSELAEISRNGLSEIRETVSDYKCKGLANTVTDLCKRLREKSLVVSLTSDIPSQLSARVESQLSLMLTELGNNILRHSQADECEINFEQTQTSLKVTVMDNGHCESISEGNGITGIRERIKALNGEFDYQTSPNCIFTIKLDIHKEQQ
ncbi:sensor histidine kinase [Parashewanella curva]|uniref:Sensor histidine kinase n=1 Tax=Parashewanella curva TaxID=2338552 RepID=A0A3L8PVH4_9GAMM|nr:sensor histidine kinase [Parashewanella curva]RLV59360.1 sensor histidine kinase [Parashewanella curva]